MKKSIKLTEKENKIIENLKVEELEQRYEMGWRKKKPTHLVSPRTFE